MTELKRAVRTFRTAVEAIQAALEGDLHGYIHVWPEHWLGVKIDRDDCRAVAVVDATVVSHRDRRVFRNGIGQRASLMPREKALRGALLHAVSILKTFEEYAA